MQRNGDRQNFQGKNVMTNYLWVCEILKGREWVPYIARKKREDAELVKANNEKYSQDKYRVRKYVRRLE